MLLLFLLFFVGLILVFTGGKVLVNLHALSGRRRTDASRSRCSWWRISLILTILIFGLLVIGAYFLFPWHAVGEAPAVKRDSGWLFGWLEFIPK